MLKYPEFDHYEKIYKQTTTFLKRWNGGTVIIAELTISHPTLILEIYKQGNEGWLELACIDPQWIQGQRIWENCEIELEAKVKLKSGEVGYIISDKKAGMNIHCVAFEAKEYLTEKKLT